MNRIPLALAALSLAFGASAAWDETTIYKSTASDGSVTYSSEGPEPDAAEVERMRIYTKPAIPAPPASVALPEDDVVAQAERDRIVRESALSAADEKVARAERELSRAQADLEAGQAIRGDEWIGNKNGSVRPRQSYVDRVTLLEQRVALARQNLDRAYQERNYLR
jgi:hypothetical protein